MVFSDMQPNHAHHQQRPASGSSEVQLEAQGKKKSSRSKMSCKQCRERKVKCNRIYPCSACVFRGRSSDCLFENSGTAVEQAQAIKNLKRQEEGLLKRINELEKLLREKGPMAKSLPLSIAPESAKATGSGELGSVKDSVFFGKLSMARLIEEYADLKRGLSRSSLIYTNPRSVDVYAYQNTSKDPFPCLWPLADKTIPLLRILPDHCEILRLFKLFEAQSQTYFFPHLPDEASRGEVGRFLSSLGVNAERNPSMLGLLFVILAHGSLIDHFGVSTGPEHPSHSSSKNIHQMGDVFMAASMQALRLSSFTNRPNTLSVQTLLMLGPYLVNTGRFLDASNLFGLTVRLAQSIGLHRDPTRIESIALTQECFMRRNIWWYILYLDQYYSSTLGCPLSVSGFGDCSLPEPLTSYHLEHSLLRFVCGFTVLTTEILKSDDLTNTEIEKYSEKLLHHLMTLPSNMQFNESWLDPAADTPAWPLDVQAADFYIKIHTYLILLNRQWQEHANREMTCQAKREDRYGTDRFWNNDSGADSCYTSVSEGERPMFPGCPPLGHQRVVESCMAVSLAFRFLFDRNKSSLIDWTLCQSGFNAAYVLGMYMHESQDYSIINFVLTPYRIFEDLLSRYSEASNESMIGRVGLLRMACERLASLLKGHFDAVGSREMADHDRERVMSKDGMALLEDPGLTRAGQGTTFYQPINWNLAALPSGPWCTADVTSDPEIWHGDKWQTRDQVMLDADGVLRPSSTQELSRASTLTSNTVMPDHSSIASMPQLVGTQDVQTSGAQYADDIDAFLSQVPVSRPPTFRSGSSGQKSFTSLSTSTNASSMDKSPQQLWSAQLPSDVHHPLFLPDTAAVFYERTQSRNLKNDHGQSFHGRGKRPVNPPSIHGPSSLHNSSSAVTTGPTASQQFQPYDPSMEHLARSARGVDLEFGANQSSSVHLSDITTGFGWQGGQCQ